MINREMLARAMKSTTVVSFFMPLVLVLFAWVAWVISSDPGSSRTALATGDFGILGLIVLTLLTFSPLAFRPLVHRGLAKVRRRAALHPELMAAKPEIFLPMHAQLSHVIWEVSAVVGFVAFILGYGWAYFLGAMLLSLAGFIIDFPRTSVVVQWADEYDAAVTQPGAVPAL